jgi:glycosyltransferase involved in cell wall biosynthesis
MSVDVVIPTHERVDFLNEALDSVLRQTLQPSNVFVVSDIRNQEAEALIQRRAKDFGGLRYEWWQAPDEIPASGRAPISRNLGIGLSRANWLAMLDDDDRWDDEYLERAIDLGGAENADVVVTHTYSNIDKSGGKHYDGCYSEHTFFVRNPGLNGSNGVFRRTSLWRIGGFNPAVLGSADKEVMIRLMRNGGKAAVVRDKLVFHRPHSGNASGNPARLLLSLNALKRAHCSSIRWFTRVALWKKALQLKLAVSRCSAEKSRGLEIKKRSN